MLNPKKSIENILNWFDAPTLTNEELLSQIDFPLNNLNMPIYGFIRALERRGESKQKILQEVEAAFSSVDSTLVYKDYCDVRKFEYKRIGRHQVKTAATVLPVSLIAVYVAYRLWGANELLHAFPVGLFGIVVLFVSSLQLGGGVIKSITGWN